MKTAGRLTHAERPKEPAGLGPSGSVEKLEREGEELRPRALSTPSSPQLTRMRAGLGVIDLPVSEMIIRRM
jgi:hypothetical protein